MPGRPVTPEEIRERVTTARVARLGTVGALGAPHLVPFCFVLDGDVLYSAVDNKPKREGRLRRFENVRREPRVAVLVDHYEEDWTRLWWVRLEGRAEELPPGAEATRALALLAEKYPQYRAQPASGPVMRVAIERWLGWAAT